MKNPSAAVRSKHRQISYGVRRHTGLGHEHEISHINIEESPAIQGGRKHNRHPGRL